MNLCNVFKKLRIINLFYCDQYYMKKLIAKKRASVKLCLYSAHLFNSKNYCSLDIFVLGFSSQNYLNNMYLRVNAVIARHPVYLQ